MYFSRTMYVSFYAKGNADCEEDLFFIENIQNRGNAHILLDADNDFFDNPMDIDEISLGTKEP